MYQRHSTGHRCENLSGKWKFAYIWTEISDCLVEPQVGTFCCCWRHNFAIKLLLSSTQYSFHCCPALNIFLSVIVQHSIFFSLLSSTQYFCHCFPSLNTLLLLSNTQHFLSLLSSIQYFVLEKANTQYFFYQCCPTLDIFVIVVQRTIFVCLCCPTLNILFIVVQHSIFFVVVVQHSILFLLLSSTQYSFHCCPALNIFVIVVQHSIFFSLLSSTQYSFHCCPALNIFCLCCPALNILFIVY